MLVLKRLLNESVLIGDNIKITVFESDKWGMRLGIEAPVGVSIHRGEVVERILNGTDSRQITGTAVPDKVGVA